MPRRIVWLVIGLPLGLIVIGAGTVLAWPTARHMISGLWNLPDRLPAVVANSQVPYQPGAEDLAGDVAALLPDAIRRVEAVHGRPFDHPVIVGVYATREAYAAANGVGSAVPVGVTFAGRVNLSPKLFRPQRQRLRAILTHELSHAHLQGWIGETAYILRLPNWFKEGLAVMISDGGGAELCSEEEARAAIQRGDQITIDDAGSLTNVVGIGFQSAPANTASWYPVVLAYREAGMFVNYLRVSDGPAFDSMMNAILDGRAFADAVSGAARKRRSLSGSPDDSANLVDIDSVHLGHLARTHSVPDQGADARHLRPRYFRRRFLLLGTHRCLHLFMTALFMTAGRRWRNRKHARLAHRFTCRRAS